MRYDILAIISEMKSMLGEAIKCMPSIPVFAWRNWVKSSVRIAGLLVENQSGDLMITVGHTALFGPSLFHNYNFNYNVTEEDKTRLYF
jgi:hypothetical protein